MGLDKFGLGWFELSKQGRRQTRIYQSNRTKPNGNAPFWMVLNQFAPENGTYGMVVSGRSIAFDQADKVLGPLFNTIPSPLNLQSGEICHIIIQHLVSPDLGVETEPYMNL